MLVLDTNVVSELMKAAPDRAVATRMRAEPLDRIFSTAITTAEIFTGVARLPVGRKRIDLQRTAEKMFALWFADRVLPFDEAAARAYATIMSTRRALGRPISILDAQIAATVTSRQATLLTRNVADFFGCGFDVVDPWHSDISPPTTGE